MLMPCRIALSAAVALALSACSGGASSGADAAPVPRREAYPRPPEPSSEYAVPQGLPVAFLVNSGAQAQVSSRPDGAAWLTLSYPAYGAVGYVTFTPADEASKAAIIDNRGERMMLNLAGAQAEASEFQGRGQSRNTVLTSVAAPQAAVQFISTLPGWVVSGAVQFPGASASAPADSIAPMVRIIYADVVHALGNL